MKRPRIRRIREHLARSIAPWLGEAEPAPAPQQTIIVYPSVAPIPPTYNPPFPYEPPQWWQPLKITC